MLPKTHALLGFIFVLVLYFITPLTFLELALIFLASIFIDVDHYLYYVNKKRDISLKRAYRWYLSLGKDHKTMMQLFHTIEFLTLITLLGLFWSGFFSILLGMVFHSALDIVYGVYQGNLYTREFSLINYLISDKKKYL